LAIAREFMAERDWRHAGKLALEEMPVGAADADGLHTDQHLARAGFPLRHIHN